MSTRGKVATLVGAQFGSEGKGAIARLLMCYDVHVRTGGPNAGHTFWFNDRAWVMQSLPCGWVNPDADLIIGPGAVLDVEQLLREMQMIRDEQDIVTLKDRVFVDIRASVVSMDDRVAEGGILGEMHRTIGSTGKGVGTCRISRIKRNDEQHSLAGKQVWRELLEANGVHVLDTVDMIHRLVNNGRSVLLEGTQGSGLSLVHGPWPFCTSGDTNSGQLATDAGLPPSFVTERILVARTMPIRVAGNSGPMRRETTWDAVSKRLGRPVTETTTVTKKTRRIGEWDDEQFAKAVQLNDPTAVFLTFIDYLDEGQDSCVSMWHELSGKTLSFIQDVESRHGVRVVGVTTGALPEHCVYNPKWEQWWVDNVMWDI